MKQLFGNYLGLCINNDDPQKRGRVQIFIPHIMPALLENWNKVGEELGEDIKLVCVGDNIPDSLPPDILDKLMKILPWAEAASPILGTSSSGNLLTQALGAIGDAAGAVAGAVGSYFNQSPVSQPVEVDPNAPGAASAGSALLDQAKRYAGSGNLGARVRGALNGNRGTGACGRGTNAVLGALTGSSAFQTGSLGGNANDFGSGGRSIDKGSGLYQPPRTVGSDYLNNPSLWRVGDVVANRGGGKGFGHIQVYAGPGIGWVSDFQQGNRVLQNSNYFGFALHRLNDKGIAAVNARSSLLGGDPNSAIAGSSELQPGGPGLENQSQSGQVAAPTPHQGPNPETDLEKNNYGSIAKPEVTSSAELSGGGSGVALNPNGSVNQASLREHLRQQIANSKLNGYVPRDGAKYGVDGSVDSWTNHFMGLAKAESNFRPGTRNDADPGGSLGIFQVSVYDGSRYGANPTGRNWTESELFNPTNNANTAIKIYEKQVLRNGAIATASGKGAGGYFAAASMRKIAAAAADGSLGNFDASATPSAPIPGGPGDPAAADSTAMINKTDPHGTTAVLNVNNMAKGVFTYPAAGSLLWVFFREGNPQFPVYFAANYGESEWASAFRLGSDAPGYKPAPTEENPITSTGGMMNLNGVGGLRWEDTNNPNDRAQDQKSLMLFGHDGSNMFFNDGYHQIYSKFDRRDQVEGDRFETTLGFKEQWVQGDYNQVVMGDYFVKIGNVSPPAVEAVERIQQIINDIMAPLAESSGGGGGSSSTREKSKFTKEAEANASQLAFEGKRPVVDENAFRINPSTFPTSSQQGQGSVGALGAGSSPSQGNSSMSINNTQSNVQASQSGNAFAINPGSSNPLPFTIRQ